MKNKIPRGGYSVKEIQKGMKKLASIHKVTKVKL